MSDRYATKGLSAISYEPGSRNRVLANKLGIIRVRDMQAAESSALLSLTHALLDEVTAEKRTGVIKRNRASGFAVRLSFGSKPLAVRPGA